MAEIYFVNITFNDNVMTGDSFHLGSVSVGSSTFINTFLLKNDTDYPIYEAKVFIHTASSYQGNKTAGEDLNEILNIWPTLTSNENEVCGLYMYKAPYVISQERLDTWMLSVDTTYWYRFGTEGTYTNPILVPSGCMPGGGEDGTIPAKSYAQIVLKFVVPDLNSLASIKCCRIGAYCRQL